MARGSLFAVWFGVLAVAIAFAMIFNGRLVMRYGMRMLSKWALRAASCYRSVFLALSLGYARPSAAVDARRYLFATFFCSGILFGNYNAIAMEPMGHIAGMAAAISGSLSSLVALGIGT